MLKFAFVVAVSGTALVSAVSSTSRASDPEIALFPAVNVVTSSEVLPQVATRFEVVGHQNVARYRVRERLVGKELDNDAVGETSKVTGAIALDKNGVIVPAASRFTATLTDIRSDSERRDGYVRRRILSVDSFPTTSFVVTGVRGLPAKLPTSGTAEFQLIGDLTVKGVTRTSTWRVKATVNGDKLTGSAITRFTFAEFQLTQPRVPILLSVVDTIALEYDFTMARKAM